MNDPSENTVRESYYNPVKSSAIRKTVALMLLIILTSVLIAFVPAFRSYSVIPLVIAAPVTLSAIADWIGYFKFKKWKKTHPGPEHPYEEFMLEMKSVNGGYTPEDFGRKR